jgi:nascent polypeptide-associated complex subunit beta
MPREIFNPLLTSIVCFSLQLSVQASIPSNTYVVSGNTEVKALQEFLPGILNQLGPENMGRLRELAAASLGAAQAQGGAAAEEEDDDDEDVPDLVENFEEAAAK